MRIAARGNARRVSRVSRTQPLTRKASPRPESELSAQLAESLGIRRVVDGVALDEIAGDAMPMQRANEILHRVAAELPDPAAGGYSVARRQIRQSSVGLLQQQRGAGCRAATPHAAAFHEDDGNTFARKSRCDERPRYAAADNYHFRCVSAPEAWDANAECDRGGRVSQIGRP